MLKSFNVNGTSLVTAIEGTGRPVLLIHGNGESHKLFTVSIRQLVEAGYQVIAPDSRGQGANPPLPEYHYADMAEDMYQLIKELGLEKPAVYGFSDGGIITLLLELMHPGTAGILAISGTNLSPQGVIPSFREEFKDNQEPLVRLMLTEPHIAPEELEKITAPILVTAGSNDLILREETETIARHLPNSELVILEGEDHGSYIDGSEIIGKMLTDFFHRHNY